MPSELSLPQQATIDAHCDKHGPYTARVIDMTALALPSVVSKCPACSEERKAAEEAAEQQRKVAEREQRVRSIIGRSGIPPRFVERTFVGYRAETVGQRVALATCRKYAETWRAQYERGGSLVLTGGPGTGKTHLACAIATTIAEQFLAVSSFGTVTQVLRHIKETYRRDSERSEQDAINDLLAPDLLIVDEVGVQTGSDHEKMLMFEVLNERYQNLRPTILISNLSSADLEAYIGQRVMDRFRECGSIVAFDWQSFRGSKAA